MDSELRRSLKLYSDVLNMYRFYPIIDKSEMTRKLNISGTTFYKAVDELQKKNVIEIRIDGGRGKAEALYGVNRDIFYMLGISIGASLCKVVFIDANFNRMPAEMFAVHKNKLAEGIKKVLIENEDDTKELLECESDPERDYIFFKTPSSFRALKQAMNVVFDHCRFLVENEKMTLFSIGISSTGILDRDKQRIISSHNLRYLGNSEVLDFFEPINRDFFLERSINPYLVQNSDASIIAEIIQMYLSNSPYKGKSNIAAIYLGYGVGSGFYLDGRIFNGARGFAGESGQLAAPCFIEECGIAARNYNENESKVDTEKSGSVLNGWDKENRCPVLSKDPMSYDKKIRKYVFEKSDDDDFRNMSPSGMREYLRKHPEDDFRNMSSSMMREYLQQHHEKAVLLGKYFGSLVKTIVNLLNVEAIVLTGKIYKSFDLISSTIDQEQNDREVELGRTVRDRCTIVKSVLGPLSPAIGAAIFSYHKKCEIPLSWNYPE